MALTAAERAKKYRDSLKADPRKHQEYLQKERKRYRKRKENGEYNIENKAPRERRIIKRKWRVQKREQREKQKNIKQGVMFMLANSPLSPSSETNITPDRQESQRQRGRKRIRRDRAKAYKTIQKLKSQLQNQKKMTEKYRKRWSRMTGRANTRKTTATQNNNKKKTDKHRLLLSVITQQIKAKYQNSKSDRDKQIISKLVSKDILKKYRLTREFSKLSGIGRTRINSASERSNLLHTYEKTGRSVVWRINIKRKILKFMQHDINSTIAPGKRDTITRRKIKKQKRFLNDTMQNLHKTFCSQYGAPCLSYASFCKFKPFWIVQQHVTDRDSCLCKLHENVRLRVEKLFFLKLLDTKNPDKLCESLVCDMKREHCAYNECQRCSRRQLSITNNTQDVMAKIVSYSNWVNKSEEITRGDALVKVQRTVKEENKSTVENLLQETQELLRTKYCRHVFNIRHQFNSLKTLKETLSENEAVVHADFSENYGCKLAAEIQSMHFGSSRKQVSLHTVVVYSKDSVRRFCSVSDDTDHGPPAIWSHLQPIIDWIHTNMPAVDTLHFISDGPTTQYRSKNNFYLYSKMMRGNNNLTNSTWNFTEAGHGKGAADGVGGVVKRTADNLVSLGNDIHDARDFYEKVRDRVKNIHMIFIEECEIERKKSEIPVALKTIKGTMKLHQIIATSQTATIFLKTSSCFCKWPALCDCYKPQNAPQTHVFYEDEVEDETLPEPTNFSKTTTGEKTKLFNFDADPSVIGKWCVVRYDEKVYPGIIQDIDDQSAEVKCMHSIGINRYFWPLFEDVIWYKWEDILALIEEPTNVTARHTQIEPLVFKKNHIFSLKNTAKFHHQ